MVSQGVGIAIGAQDKFSFTQVALSAVSAGVTKGLSGENFGISNQYLSAAARAAVTNIATQGIGIVTGLQQKFNWRSVAAAGISTVAGEAARSALNETDLGGLFGTGKGLDIARASLTGISAGLTSAALRGGRVSIQQIATDAFGNALGSSLGDLLNGSSVQEETAFDVQRAAEYLSTSERFAQVASTSNQSTIFGPTILSTDDNDLPPPQQTVTITGKKLNFFDKLFDDIGEFFTGSSENTASSYIGSGYPYSYVTGKNGERYRVPSSIGQVTALNDLRNLSANYAGQPQHFLVPGRGILESDIQRLDRLARAPGANTLENQVGPVIQPFVIAATTGGVGLAATGGFQFGQGYAQIRNGDTGLGVLNVAGGLLQGVGAFGLARQTGALGSADDVARVGANNVGGITAAERSATFQGVATYEGIDRMRNIGLQEGSRVAHVTFREDGLPVSEYFTTESAINRSRLSDGTIDANRLNQGLQIYAGKDPITGLQRPNFKPMVQFFEVAEPIAFGQAAFGRTLENPLLNPGGYKPLPQIFINKEVHSSLRPINIERATNTGTPDYPF